MKQFIAAVLVLSPLLGGLLLHGLCIRYGWLQRLAGGLAYQAAAD